MALVGDAAATTDPTYGQGLLLSICAARVLHDEPAKNSDWEAAGHRYAEASAEFSCMPCGGRMDTYAFSRSLPGSGGIADQSRLFGECDSVSSLSQSKTPGSLNL